MLIWRLLLVAMAVGLVALVLRARARANARRRELDGRPGEIEDAQFDDVSDRDG
jgi:hypothetical protein